MTQSARDAYIAGIDPRFGPLVLALDRAILAARPDLDVKISYRMLMYTLRAGWRHWVCAIDARKDRVCLRFLYGAYLSDPARVLRSGSSHLSTIDYAGIDQVDESVVTAYVAEAVSRYDEFVAREREVPQGS